MKKNFRKILCALVSAVMLFSGVTAFAATPMQIEWSGDYSNSAKPKLTVTFTTPAEYVQQVTAVIYDKDKTNPVSSDFVRITELTVSDGETKDIVFNITNAFSESDGAYTLRLRGSGHMQSECVDSATVYVIKPSAIPGLLNEFKGATAVTFGTVLDKVAPALQLDSETDAPRKAKRIDIMLNIQASDFEGEFKNLENVRDAWKTSDIIAYITDNGANAEGLKSRIESNKDLLSIDTQATAPTFNDVPSSHWANSYVTALASKKIINGYDDNTFKPNNNVTREEFVKMIVGATELSDYALMAGELDTDVEKKLLWAMVDKRFSNVLEFKAEELAVTSSAYSLTNIVYYEADGDTESAKVNPMADVIYNYSRCGIPKLEDVKPLTGTIRLIDNDDDEIYDVVVVNEYKNMFIKQTSTDGHHLIGKYSQTIDIDKYEVVRIEKNGVEIEPEKIGHGVLVSYIENKEQTKIYIYVQSEKTKATLDATRLSRARTLYSIGDNEYRLSATYSKLLTDADVYAVTPVIGKEYTFYFDMAGEIAEVQQTTGDMQYALLMSTRAGEPYEDGEAYARLLLTDGSKVSGVIEKKVTVNGQRKSASEFLADTHLCDEYGEPKTQVVKVQFGEEGNLVKLDFANDIRNATDLYPYGFDEEKFSLDYSDKSSSIRSQDGYILCNNRYLIKNDTVVFCKCKRNDIRSYI